MDNLESENPTKKIYGETNEPNENRSLIEALRNIIDDNDIEFLRKNFQEINIFKKTIIKRKDPETNDIIYSHTKCGINLPFK